MKTWGGQDDGFQMRVHMTFSERAHPRFIEALRTMAPRARSRLIRTLVERALALGPEGDLQAGGLRPGLSADPAMGGGRGTQRPIQSPVADLSSTGSLADAEEMDA